MVQNTRSTTQNKANTGKGSSANPLKRPKPDTPTAPTTPSPQVNNSFDLDLAAQQTAMEELAKEKLCDASHSELAEWVVSKVDATFKGETLTATDYSEISTAAKMMNTLFERMVRRLVTANEVVIEKEDEIKEKTLSIDHLLKINRQQTEAAEAAAATAAAAAPSPNSYARVTAGSARPTSPARPVSDLLGEIRITSEDPSVTGSQIDAAFKENATPWTDGIKIDGVRIEKAAIRVKISRESKDPDTAVDRLLEQTSKLAGLVVKRVQKVRPRIKLLDIDCAVGDDELKDRIFKHNDEIKDCYKEDYGKFCSDFIVIGRSRPSNTNRCVVFCVLTAELRELIIRGGKIRSGFTLHSWRDVVAPRQCKQCWQFGHPEKFCRNEPKCCNCGGPKHGEDRKCDRPTNCGNCTHHNTQAARARGPDGWSGRNAGTGRSGHNTGSAGPAVHWWNANAAVRATGHHALSAHCETLLAQQKKTIADTEYITPFIQ